MSKPKRAKQWPPIYSQPNRSGQLTYYVDLRSVAAGRPGYATLAEARTRAEQSRIARANDGNAAFTLTQDIRLDALKANDILSPRGWTLHDAAKWIDKHVFAYLDAPPVKDIVARYIAESEARNLRPRTIGDLRHRLNTFAADFGDSKLSEISLDELREWAMDEAWEPRTRINFLTKISQLYGYAIRRKWADTNLAANIDRPMVDETTPEIYSLSETEKLLTHANEFGLLPYVAIGLFAGVRSAEQIRLAGKAINFETQSIVIGADVAKKRGQRIIEMNDTLLAWLEPCKDALHGPIYGDTARFRQNKENLIEAVGFAWKPNALRHSFGSYHLAMHQNIEQTAHLMGNSPDMIHRHYKALVTKEEAEKFWGLRPSPRDTSGSDSTI
jgi:integrase